MPKPMPSLAATTEQDDGYPQLEELVRQCVAGARWPLFTTSAENLYQLYLAELPQENRQHYNCRACERFFEKFGGLVSIEADGYQLPVMLPLSPPTFFLPSLTRLRSVVFHAKVTGVFLSSEKTWGLPKSPVKVAGAREWTHLSGQNAKVFTGATQNAEQAMAEKLQDFIMLKRGLSEFSGDVVRQAVRVLQSDTLSRGEKTLGVAEWFLKLHEAVDGTKSRKDNIVWRAVATAPPGFCHVRSTMISTLLDDIVAGQPFEVISRKWSEKMHPLQYQRPTAPPSEGAIKQAEALVATLKSAGALERRFARLSEVVALWEPSSPAAAEKRPGGGIFDHLKLGAPNAQEVELPTRSITWDKFQRTVLPAALEMQYLPTSGMEPFFGLVTAVNPDAPAILQWDGLDGQPRNPVSWYFYHGGSPAQFWNLCPGVWVKVNAVCLKPPAWQHPEKFAHQGEGTFFILEGCRDMKHTAGGCLFPETLKAEYHGVRSVMEAYSRTATIAGRDEGDANGIAVSKDKCNVTLRVKTVAGYDVYKVDRWD